MSVNQFRTRSPFLASAVGAVAGALGITVYLLAGTLILPTVLLLFAVWIVVTSILHSMVEISEEGVSFMTIRGRQRWLWTEITEAHLSGTGTIPGIAIYRGSLFLRLGRSQFSDLGVVARYIETRVPLGSVRSSWSGIRGE
jgi:hypothetical protein